MSGEVQVRSRHSERRQRMHAVVQERYGDVDVLQYREVARPEIGDGEVLVRVRAAGIDPSVWHLMEGTPYLVRLMGFGLRRPTSPTRGLDVAGVVEAVGANVTGFQPGDEVLGADARDGAFAEYAVVRDELCLEKPASLSFEQAAAVPVSAITALQALRDKGRVHAGQHVLIIGAAGGVGTYAVQLAKRLGADVTGVCSTAKMELVRSLGADHVIDYTQHDPIDGSRRYDLILDGAGNRPLARLRRALAPRGTLVFVGGEAGGRWLGGLQRQLLGALLTPFIRQRLVTFVARTTEADLRYLGDLLERGELTPVVDRSWPLAELAEAIRYVRSGRARGKVVVTA